MMLLLFVSFLATTALAGECPALDSPFYFIPHETDCSKFYICAHGVSVLQSCPNGTHFSPMHLVCQYPVLAGCDPTLPDLCPDWSLRPRPYLDSCSKFYVCQSGNIHVFDCPEELEFNAELQQCVWPQDSNCTQGDQAAGDRISEQDAEQVVEQVCEDGALSANVDCSKYTVCSHGVLLAADCPSGLHWNSELAQCVWPQDSYCAQGDQAADEQVTEQDGEQVVEQVCEDGELSANVDCSKYTVCSHGILVAADCPAGLHWNSQYAFCDWPASAGCDQ